MTNKINKFHGNDWHKHKIDISEYMKIQCIKITTWYYKIKMLPMENWISCPHSNLINIPYLINIHLIKSYRMPYHPEMNV